MIAVDSSILLRHIMLDDEDQSPLASDLLENHLTHAEPGLVTVVTLYETYWALRNIYKRSAADIMLVVYELLNAPNLVLEHAEEVAKAQQSGVGFGDALIHLIGKSLGASKTLTFDKKFARIEGVELLS